VQTLLTFSQAQSCAEYELLLPPASLSSSGFSENSLVMAFAYAYSMDTLFASQIAV